MQTLCIPRSLLNKNKLDRKTSIFICLGSFWVYPFLFTFFSCKILCVGGNQFESSLTRNQAEREREEFDMQLAAKGNTQTACDEDLKLPFKFRRSASWTTRGHREGGEWWSNLCRFMFVLCHCYTPDF